MQYCNLEHGYTVIPVSLLSKMLILKVLFHNECCGLDVLYSL